MLRIVSAIKASFAHQFCPDLRPQWTDALSPEEEARPWHAIQPLLDPPDESYDLHRRFFFGDPEMDTPPAAGYTVGYHIVQQYLKNHPTESVVDWTQKDPHVILSESGYPAG